MTGFISFVCNGVQPLHKGVTGIGAAGQAALAGGLHDSAILPGIRFARGPWALIADAVAAVKIFVEINCNAGRQKVEVSAAERRQVQPRAQARGEDRK